MSEQKFFPGDRVRVRQYDEIDELDIGTANYDHFYCYGIPKKCVDRMADRPDGFIIRSGRWNEDRGMFIYELDDPDTGNMEPYWWAQGMLRPYEEETVPDADESGLFGYLLV